MNDSKSLVAGTLLGHFCCSACGSNDNLAVYVKHDDSSKEYLDGSCFSPDCSHKFWTEEQLREEGILEEGFVTPKVKPVTKTAITKAEYKALTARHFQLQKKHEAFQEEYYFPVRTYHINSNI